MCMNQSISRRKIEVNGSAGVAFETGDPTSVRTIVIVASMLVRDKSYRTTADALAGRGWRVIVLELPGSGRASPVRLPWTMSDYANWLGQCLPALDLRHRPIVVGHSNSGPPVIECAVISPSLFRAIALCDVTGFDTRFSLWPMIVGRAIDGAIEWRLTLRGLHHVLFNLFFHFRNCMSQILLAGKSDLRAIALRIALPTLIGWGERDHTCPRRTFDLLGSLLPNALTHTSHLGSHDWLITDPEDFCDALETFEATLGNP